MFRRENLVIIVRDRGANVEGSASETHDEILANDDSGFNDRGGDLRGRDHRVADRVRSLLENDL